MKPRILVAPLNWGLGHATRCMPIIEALITNHFEPVIASDGLALALLRKEYPELLSFELPSYNITYSKKGKHFKFKLLKQSPKLVRAIKAEKKAIKKIVAAHKICGIISDNRLGVYSKKVPSVFITHQLNVLSGNTTWLSSKINEKFIKRFKECWVPDAPGPINLSGKLGHVDSYLVPLKYLGPLSRFNKKETKITYDVLVLLSGPEPQRTMLEIKLLKELIEYPGKIVFIKGIVESEQIKVVTENITIYNFMTSKELEKTINKSALIIARSGYTTIMDLAKLNKKAFFIPTPGQFEQEYLAKRLSDMKRVPSCNQDDFTMSKLKEIEQFNGLEAINEACDFRRLFGLFQSE